MNAPLAGSHVDPMDPVTAAFRRAAEAEEEAHDGGRAAPPLAAVRGRAALVRGRRRAAVALVSAAVVVPLVVGVAVHRSSHRVAPAPATRSEPPAGSFLRPADLGEGRWTVLEAADGSADVRRDTIPMDGCADPAHAFAPQVVTVTGRSRGYLGFTPEGVAWKVTEDVGRFDPAARRTVLASLRAMATCKDTAVQVVLGAGADAVAWGTPRAGLGGAIGAATAYVLVGDTLVRLDMVPGTLDDGPALPGQASWLLRTLGAAARRAGGTAVAMPEPTPAATRAAAAYRQLRPDEVKAVPDNRHPLGLLSLSGVPLPGAAAAMAPGPGPTGSPSLATPIRAHLPACPGGPSREVFGRGATVNYVGPLHGRFPMNGTVAGGWSLNELRITMSPAQAAVVRTALDGVGRCPNGRIVVVLPEGLTAEILGPGRVIGWQRGPQAAMAANAWILHGDRLVQLYAAIGSASAVDDGSAWSGRQAWFRQLVDAAEHSMDG